MLLRKLNLGLLVMDINLRLSLLEPKADSSLIISWQLFCLKQVNTKQNLVEI